MMDGVDHILWINLDRATDRRARMEKMLASLRISCIDCCLWSSPPSPLRDLFTSPFPKENIRRISAVDGYKENIFEYIDFEGHAPNCCAVAKRNDIKTTFMEFACLISHLLAIHEFCRCGEPGQIALIMEDDMTLDFQIYWDRSVREICAAAAAHDPTWDIVQLASISGRPPEEDTPDFRRIEHNNINGLYSTGAYLIKYESAVNFINHIYDDKKRTYVLDRFGGYAAAIPTEAPAPVYYLADHYLYTFNRTYNYKYPYFVARYNEISTIHVEHGDFHNQSRRKYEAFLQKRLATRGEPIFRGFFFVTAATASAAIAAATLSTIFQKRQ